MCVCVCVCVCFGFFCFFFLRQGNAQEWFPRWLSGNESACQSRRRRRRRFTPWVGKIPWRRKWQPPPVFLPGKSPGQRSLAGYSPWGCKASNTTEYAHMQYSVKNFPLPANNQFAKSSSVLFSERHWGHRICWTRGVSERLVCFQGPI